MHWFKVIEIHGVRLIRRASPFRFMWYNGCTFRNKNDW